MEDKTWFHRWLREESLTDLYQVKAAAGRRESIERLILLAEADQDSPPPITASTANSVVAGRTLDLTTHLTCPHPECRVAQVDELFSHIWHYFDQIRVVGPDSHTFIEAVSDYGIERVGKGSGLLDHAQVLFHIRDIGGEELLQFDYKHPACPVHGAAVIDLPRLQLSDESEDRLADMLLAGGRLEPVKGRRAGFFYHHRSLVGAHFVKVRQLPDAKFPGESMQRRVARRVIFDHWLAAATDLHFVEESDTPLGAGIPLEMAIVRELRPSTSAASVAFNLKLPVIDGLSPRQLLEFRRDEGAHFEAFRIALKAAAQERLDADPSADPSAVAQQVHDDLLKPAIIDIERSLQSAHDVFARKNNVTILLAGLATACGVLGALPIASTIGTAAVANSAKGKLDKIDAEAKISMNNMWFMWKAEELARLHPQRASRRRRVRKGSG